jgi:hypothetical protein
MAQSSQFHAGMIAFEGQILVLQIYETLKVVIHLSGRRAVKIFNAGNA